MVLQWSEGVVNPPSSVDAQTEYQTTTSHDTSCFRIANLTHDHPFPFVMLATGRHHRAPQLYVMKCINIVHGTVGKIICVALTDGHGPA